MFLDNKYLKYYYNIVNNAKSRITEGYTERHHIVPRSLGGDNSEDNLVNLTAREHFVCHVLLTKFTTGFAKDKMIHAVWLMVIMETTHVNSRVYESLRVKHALAIGRTNKGRIPWNKGKKIGAHSEDRKKKISESVKIKMKELGYNVK